MTGSEHLITTVKVNLGEKSYPIYVGTRILPEVGGYAARLEIGRRLMVVTNPTVNHLYGRVVTESLQEAGFQVVVGEIPDGEEFKTLESARSLYDTAFAYALDRKCAVLALGGGVIGDLAGFVAATYMRGVPLLQVPTTLLAQVDSSVGGKVAVNLPGGKNIIGAFYQPKMVFTDISTLNTLPEREFRAGMAEVIKYGIIRDGKFFAFLEREQAAVKRLSPAEMVRIIKTSCSIKARVVEEDETEQGLRAILNYGHTFGHAYEALTGYKKFIHGEAVALGMISAAGVAVQLNLLTAENEARIRRLIRRFGLPENFGELAPAAIVDSMYRDKKTLAGKVRFVLPETIGRVRIVTDIPAEVLAAVLSRQQTVV